MKNRNYGWQYLTLQNNTNIFSHSDLENALNLYWNEVMDKLDDSTVVALLFKVKLNNGLWKTIAPLQKVNNTNFNKLLNTLKLFININGNNYDSLETIKIQFQYSILDKSATAEIVKPLSNEVTHYKINGYNLPLTTDLNSWGTITEQKGNKITLDFDLNTETVVVVKISSNKQTYKFMIEDKELLSITDTFGNNPTSFTRTVNDKKLIVENGIIVFKSQIKKVGGIKPTKPSKDLKNKFLTLDIETRTLDGIISPYCISFYDGKKATSFYLSNFKSSDLMLIAAIKSLMRFKYSGQNVYVHNGSSFDYIFLLRIITQIGKVNPLIKDGKFINLELCWGKINEKTNKHEYSINFRDSLLMLPSSLRKLSKAFNVENKGHFPFRFVNDPAVSLQYEGLTPKLSFYDSISKDEYNTMANNNWNLKNETIKYCLLDCIVLYKVISKFNELIFTKWSLNIHRFPTLSSLAFAIFRTHYLGNVHIPKLGGHTYDFIKQSYTGGRVDVIKPQGQDLFYYDVNSLYPTVYSSMPMPVGNPTWFEGNILNCQPDAFGFFKCNITAPSDLNIPVLQTHVKTNNGMRTIAALGNWTDVLFSEEMNLAIKYGYKIEVLEGYTFDKAVIFDKYASDLFAIKQSHAPSDPMYLISKLLLNSLYGRFGMNLDLIEHRVINNNELFRYIGKSKAYIPEIIDLNNGKSIVSITKIRDKKHESDTAKLNVSIGVASAITSYARIFMTPFLQNPNYNVYYSDTDSIITDGPIDSKHIGKELGQMKLEYKISNSHILFNHHNEKPVILF
jgi:hypothetical protein